MQSSSSNLHLLPESTTNKRAIVTVVIGDRARRFASITTPFLHHYGARIGADVVVVDEKWSYEGPTPHYAKMICGELLERYERVVFLDDDVLVARDCPDIFALVPETHFGAFVVDKHTNYHDKGIQLIQEVLPDLQWKTPYFNSGVMVASRAHRAVFDMTTPDTRLWMANEASGLPTWYDQTILNYKVQQLGIPLFDIEYKFNHTTVCHTHERFSSHMIHCKGHRKGDRLDEIKHAAYVLERPWLRWLFKVFPALARRYDQKQA
jgi:lipopolysaccharide biosynthesis glycosyltransferase